MTAVLYRYPEGYAKVMYHFDFFNYAGIHQPVKLYMTPGNRVEDITIKTTPALHFNSYLVCKSLSQLLQSGNAHLTHHTSTVLVILADVKATQVFSADAC